MFIVNPAIQSMKSYDIIAKITATIAPATAITDKSILATHCERI